MNDDRFQEIKPALIEAGYRARMFLGPSLVRVRERAREFGVSLTWRQESDVLLAVQQRCRESYAEPAADRPQPSADKADPPEARRVFLAETANRL